MNFFMSFLVFALVFTVFGWLIEKSNFDNKLVNKLKKYKNFKLILVLIIIIFGFSLEYGKQLLDEIFGQHNITSSILGAIVGIIYTKFFPFIFKKNKS